VISTPLICNLAVDDVIPIPTFEPVTEIELVDESVVGDV